MSCVCKTEPNDMPCICNPKEFPFECQLHKNNQGTNCRKTEHWWRLCKERSDYGELWQQGNGPCLNHQYTAIHRIGLGDAVAWILEKFGINPWPGCGCAERKAFLNRIKLWPLLNLRRN